MKGGELSEWAIAAFVTATHCAMQCHTSHSII